MTLTSLLPTLRDSIPSPFDKRVWPAGAVPRTDDVTISAMSLVRYAEICGTPCVCSGPAVIRDSGGRASATDSVTVVVATVAAADRTTVRVDARLHDVDAVWSEARLIGRVSHAYDQQFALYDESSDDAVATVTLPGDPRVGDRIAIPVPGHHCVGEIRTARIGR